MYPSRRHTQQFTRNPLYFSHMATSILNRCFPVSSWPCLTLSPFAPTRGQWAIRSHHCFLRRDCVTSHQKQRVTQVKVHKSPLAILHHLSPWEKKQTNKQTNVNNKTTKIYQGLGGECTDASYNLTPQQRNILDTWLLFYHQWRCLGTLCNVTMFQTAADLPWGQSQAGYPVHTDRNGTPESWPLKHLHIDNSTFYVRDLIRSVRPQEVPQWKREKISHLIYCPSGPGAPFP